ncbi:DNA (cytosine-5-)-methyltransferase family protein [Burkholderia thailandensis MSMB121]|uniref:DNA cytosine methyltransferase n=1 Tax=Burkholderia humptydooensis TaxID=430531 RepID=UPI0003280A84|nr:DNA cytosine methyltransferase [Burkholderia humptydooensis]AGK46213.1 DNA (cytosine-5-)-methyltransferase family protein [Burkholderia thailandensis MSMB121]ATF37740.1 DNA cytosine methyltransferase [Burkholderia thailandensis]
MIYGSVCSGIEAATVAWHSLGWRPAWFSEIERFPCAVLRHHYPTVPNLGDMKRFKEWPDAAIDLLVGGTPCQSFSVAGLRKGLDDPRGNLMLTYLAIARRYAPRWLVWENVPGVLSSNGGRDFGTFLGGLAELGYGFAYRVLDAQYVRVESHPRAVPQRRRRVFVVGHLGDWRRAAAVLFERESLFGHPAPSREAGQRIAPTLSARTRGGGGLGTDFECDGGLIPEIARALTTSNQRIDAETETLFVAHALRGEGFDASEDGTGRGTPLVPVPFDTTQITSKANRSQPRAGDPCHLLAAGAHAPAIAYAIQAGATRENPDCGPDGVGVQADIAYTLEVRAEVQAVADTLTSHWHQSNGATAGNNAGLINPIFHGPAVRRLTPMECERLQGFPDRYTAIQFNGKPAKDSPRYKALGNSMAVNVMRWIGSRIELVESLTT